MSQREKLFPASIPTIPHTQGGGGLVWEHHVVLRLVEHGLSLVLLQTHQVSDSSSFQVDLFTCLPVEPAPVYAMRHLLVESSHNFTKESFPDDSTYFPFLKDNSSANA